MTINNNAGLFKSCNWNEYNLNLLTRTHWRASLVPAAAVIPAPIAYIKVVAVKKLVVGCRGSLCNSRVVDASLGGGVVLTGCSSSEGSKARTAGGTHVTFSPCCNR